MQSGRLAVPQHPTIPYIEGDGSGADIWRAAQRVLDAAIQKTYAGKRSIRWLEVLAGEKALKTLSTPLPAETIQAFQKYSVGIKGPLGTPVGGGMRSLNVALRQQLDLYACVRPVRHFSGVPSPMLHPERVDVVLFRENTEDVYTGIEFEADTPKNRLFLELMQENFPEEHRRLAFSDSLGIGIKPISRRASQRLVRAAIRYALEHKRRSVTLLHKGNIMKYTEGSFCKWGYEVAQNEFANCITLPGENVGDSSLPGKLPVRDIIADAAFAAMLTRPQDFDVLATPNHIGDILSDSLAAQVGGLGIAPGANINYETGAAIFEATHGTAPDLAGQDRANPCSLILSGEMMLRHLGWCEAADAVLKALERTMASRLVTADFYTQMEGATLASTSQFADAFIHNL